ncbi:hypothetical protein BpHYR1_013591 [Brachionus plicatilis]|uniref:Uncharacterized protein n=1 Tax=Brachionus plicatilis TaxID=10195 RepID=A0A3M7RRR2_BRAPC|nr:hypothetical protein BpHYR1_013591 [Brachionus plicatilis]
MKGLKYFKADFGFVQFLLKKLNEQIKTLSDYQQLENLSSEGRKHVLGGRKDVSVATIYRICFSPSELKLWNFLYLFLIVVSKFAMPISSKFSFKGLKQQFPQST